MMNFMTLTTWTKTWIRGFVATVAVIAIWLNPSVKTVALPVVEMSSDAAVEIKQKPVREKSLSVRAYVQARASRNGWSWAQWRAVVALVNLENRSWNVYAKNREGSSAYGLFQILRTPHGTPLRKQVDRFIRYINGRYDGDPVKALAHWHKHGWY